MVSNMTVHVGRTVQFIRCDLRPDVDSRACFSSPMSKLRVQYFPHKNDISCGPHDPKPFHEGDAMPISCEVLRSTPAVDMRWSLLPDATIISLSPHHDGIWNRGLLHDLPITKSLHMKRLVCEVTSELVFPERLLQCFIGPIMVYHAPRVIVQPSNAEVGPDHLVEFMCVANGYPDHFEYSWTCLPHGLFKGCESVSKTAEVSLGINVDTVSLEGLAAEVRCIVSNSIGRATGSSHVNVLPIDMSSHLTTPLRQMITAPLVCPSDIELSIAVLTHNMIDFGSTGVKVRCTVNNLKGHDDIQIYWYLNENKVTKENDSFQQQRLSSFTSEVTWIITQNLDYHAKVFIAW